MKVFRSHIVVMALAAVALAGTIAAAGAEALTAGEKAEIQAVIERQIEAFRQDDALAAFDLASPAIRAMFGTPEAFMRMVREGYRPVYRPRRVTFLDIVDVEGMATQRVLVVGPDGQTTLALYPMERQPDGRWRIDGCYLIPAPGEET